MYTGRSNIKIFSCNANTDLAAAIAKNLGLNIGQSEVTHFSDGEISVKIDETIRGADVFIIQSTSQPVND
ncbi:MAG: ribose-phosphate pyrophosphokinase-like domain-containing protein, partial [Lachnospiraceae bacterium]|nr:ribose-phosphate pyrophosphokinase-like domain-containing protein [Lachnospiraceae bacterium]